MQATVYRVKKIQFNLQINKQFSTEFAMAKFRENVYIRNICQTKAVVCEELKQKQQFISINSI